MESVLREGALLSDVSTDILAIFVAGLIVYSLGVFVYGKRQLSTE